QELHRGIGPHQEADLPSFCPEGPAVDRQQRQHDAKTDQIDKYRQKEDEDRWLFHLNNARCGDSTLVCCSQIGWAFVASHLAFGAARRGSISAAICDRGATKPKAKCGATRWAACLFGSDSVVRSLQTAEGYARRSRLV